MPKRHFIKAAIKHPGRETARAARNGVSVHAQLERDAQSDDPSLRGAGQMGLNLEKMHHRKSNAQRAASRYGKG